MATRRTIEFLTGQKVKFAVLHHSPAFTSQEVAASAHIPGRSMAKTLAVKIDGRLALAVVSANRDVDMGQLQSAARATKVTLASREEFVNRFDGCQFGAMPPFGNLFGMETYVDEELAKQQFISFNAGSHTEVVSMRTCDYQKIAHPHLARFSTESIPGTHCLHALQL